MERIQIRAASPYTVCIGRGILKDLPDLIRERTGRGKGGHSPRILVVSDRRVAERYLDPVLRSFSASGLTARAAVFRGGERLKSARPLFSLVGRMVREGLARDSLVVALGGGVIGDFAGFAASIFMRGCGLVQVPTTLLAQVDSSVGGKVGIDLREGKNLAGSFHNPLLVLCDVDVLDTLPAREVVSGLGEVVKYGLIRDRWVFERLETALATPAPARPPPKAPPPADPKETILGNDELLLSLIRRSVEIKGGIVEADEREGGLRMVLNFGHTFGHALEQITRYRRFLHGEAVLLGMRMATELSVSLGKLPAGDGERVLGLLERFRIPTAGNVGADAVVRQMERDKKRKGGVLRVVVLAGIGRAEVVDVESAADRARVTESVERVLRTSRRRGARRGP